MFQHLHRIAAREKAGPEQNVQHGLSVRHPCGVRWQLSARHTTDALFVKENSKCVPCSSNRALWSTRYMFDRMASLALVYQALRIQHGTGRAVAELSGCGDHQALRNGWMSFACDTSSITSCLTLNSFFCCLCLLDLSMRTL
jgi:hypothetical protein